MEKIVGYRYIGIVNGLQQFSPIIEEPIPAREEAPPYTIETDYIRGVAVRYLKGFVDNHKLIRTIEPYHTKEQCDNLWYNTVHQYHLGEYDE